LFAISRGNITNQKELISDPTGIVFIAQNDSNNGFVDIVKPEKHKQFIKNSLIVGRQTGIVYFQEADFITTDGVLVLLAKPNLVINRNIGLFIEKSLTKKMFSFGYTNTVSAEKLNKITIQLPTKNGEIDFEFMENFMAELEVERVENLQAYLVATGLRDYTLTAEEQQVLVDFENGKVTWGEFKIGDLFEKLQTKKLPFKADELPKEIAGKYNIPCLTSSFKNQGLNYFVPKDNVTILKNVISIPSNSDVYRAYYQSNEFTILSDAYAVRWIYGGVELMPNQYLFTVQCINQVTDLSIYSYKNKLGGWNVVKNKHILLPTQNNHPDYAIMETLIRAIQKLVIKDVVLYVDGKVNK
jgi:Type I restriction modification DNA specificity domain